MSVPSRITFGAKENHAVTFAKLQEAFLAGLRTEGITSMLCTVSIDSKEIPALYQMRWGHLQESELDEIPVTGISTGMEKLTGKQFEALEKQMRKAVNALRSGEQSTLPSSTGSLKTPTPTDSNTSKTPSASSSRSINKSLMDAWQDGKKSSESSTSKSTSEEKLLSTKTESPDSVEDSSAKPSGLKSMVGSGPSFAESLKDRMDKMPPEIAKHFGLGVIEMRSMTANSTVWLITTSWEQEPPSWASRRLKWWNWLTSCLMAQHDAKVRGPFSSLIEKVNPFDVSALYNTGKKSCTKCTSKCAQMRMG